MTVVDALYAFVEHPERASDIFEALERLVTSAGGVEFVPMELILTHADRAMRLAEKVHGDRRNVSEGSATFDAVFLSAQKTVKHVSGDAASRLEPFLRTPLKVGETPRWHGEASSSFDQAFQSALLKKTGGLFPVLLADTVTGERCGGFVMTRDAVPPSLAAGADAYHCALVLAVHKGPSLATERLKESLRLTGAEWRLAEKLQAGLTLSEAAEDLGVTIATARSTLKQVFAKTGVHKQSELVGVLTDASRILPDKKDVRHSAVRDPGRRFLRLTDGRVFAYRDYGPPGGVPCIFFHSTMHASLLQEEAIAPAEAANIRMIAIDRPGFGHSTPAKSYTFASVAGDVERLADHLGLSHVLLTGTGVGCAFALATAKQMGRRVVCVTLTEPRLSKIDRETGRGFFHRAHAAVLQQRWFHRVVGELFHRGRHRAMALMYIRKTDEGLAETDIRRADPKFVEAQVARGLDAFEKSGRGMADELTLLATSDGESPVGLDCPIAVWHGRKNDWIPVEESIRHFQHHPTSELHIVEDSGTFLPVRLYDDMIKWSLGHWRERGRGMNAVARGEGRLST